MGSRLHELARAKDTSQTRKLARQYAEQALHSLLDDARAKALSIEVPAPQTDWLQLSIMVKHAGGNFLTFTHPVKVV